LNKQKLIFFSSLPPFRGGIAQFSERLLKELVNSYDVIPFTFKSQYPNWLFPGKTQYKTNTLGDLFCKRIVSTFNPFSYFTSLKIIKNENPDILVINYWMTFMAPMYVFWAKRLPERTLRVAVVHNFIPHESRFFDRIFNNWFVNNFDLFIALSAKVEQDIIQANPKARVLHLPHPSYDHFHNPIETSNARKLLNIHKEKHTLLFFGIIREYKGLDILIRAFSSLPSTFQLVIAGEVYGNDEEYKFLISQSKNQQIFLFNEFISDEKVHLFFSSADLCVLPYRSGTQSGVKAIADRMLVPCLISNVGGIAEKIDNDKDGFVLEELNPGALTNRINELFEGNSMQKIKETLRLKKNKVESSWHFFEEKMKEKIEEISLINVQE